MSKKQTKKKKKSNKKLSIARDDFKKDQNKNVKLPKGETQGYFDFLDIFSKDQDED